MQSPHPPHGNRTEPVRGSAFARVRAHAGIVQCHLRHVYGLRAYDVFKFVKLLAKPNRRGRAEPVNPYEYLTAASCLRREASGKPHGKGDTGSVDPSQAKCELGIRHM